MSRPPLFTPAFTLAFAASFLNSLAFFSLVHLPGYLHDLGADEVLIGWAIGTLHATAILMRPSIGSFMDRRGRRGVARMGALLHTVACALYLTVHDTGIWLFAVRAFHGISLGMIFSVVFTMAADLVPESRRTEGMAIFGISGMLPVSLGALLGDFVLAHGEYADLFLVATGISALAFLMALKLPESRPSQAPGGPDEPPASFWAAARQRELLPLWLVGLVFAMALAGYFTFLKTYALEEEIGDVSGFFTPYALSAVALRVFLGWVPDRLGPKRTLFPAIVCVAVGLLVLADARSATALAVSGTLCGIGHGYAFPIISALVVTRARAAERGAAVTLFTALFDLGSLIGGPLLGAIIEATDYRTMYVSAAGIALEGLLLFGLWDRHAVSPRPHLPGPAT